MMLRNVWVSWSHIFSMTSLFLIVMVMMELILYLMAFFDPLIDLDIKSLNCGYWGLEFSIKNVMISNIIAFFAVLLGIR